MNKSALISQIIEKLNIEMENLSKAARTARADATGAESKAENKYDTRGLEAAYLAEAQAKMAAETKASLSLYKDLEPQAFAKNAAIALTALVELESEDGVGRLYFLGPAAGGVKIEYDSKQILLITPSSPLGGQLMGKRVGDALKINAKEYEIISVC
jgi:transcription elongation GreA/GreB family factor